MYTVHLAILIVFFLFGLVSLPSKLPEEIKKDGWYIQVFYKMAECVSSHLNSNGFYRGRGTSLIKKQLSMLNPVGNKQELLASFRIRRLGKAIFLIFCGNVIALIVCLIGMSSTIVRDGGLIGRNDYGCGEKNVTVDVLADGERVLSNETLSISERQYTEDEIRNQFEEIGTILEQQILGKNESLDVVCYDLNLVRSIDGYPVSIEWELSNYDVMTGDGEIRTDNTVSGGTILELTARMKYFDFVGEHHFLAVIYPPRPDSEESFIRHLKEAMSQYENRTLSYEDSILPSEVDGRKITYEVPNTYASLWILIAVVIVSAGIYKCSEQSLASEMRKRDMQMMMDYPQIVSKLVLLIGAGMTIQAAVTKLASDYESRRGKIGMRYAYEELLLAVRRLRSGISEGEAYVEFGSRCRIQKYVKLGVLLSQNLKKGAGGLLETLEAEERDAFEERKAIARRLGEEAGTKLLIPMGIMLIIVMVIIIFPAFLSF